MIEISLLDSNERIGTSDDWIDELTASGAPSSPPVQNLSGKSIDSSSVARSDQIGQASRFCPQLEPPRNLNEAAHPPVHYMIDLIHLHDGVQDTVKKELGLLDEQWNVHREELRQLEEEKNKMLQEYAKEIASKNTWNVWSSIAHSLIAGTSIVLGASTLQTAPCIGALLIAYGIVGLTNKTIQATGGWHKLEAWFRGSVELEKSYARKMEMCAFCLELGLGMMGGVASLANGILSPTFLTRENILRNWRSSIQLVGSGTRAAFYLQKGFVEKRVSDLGAHLTALDTSLEQKRIEMREKLSEAVQFIQLEQSVAQEIQQANTALAF